MRVTAPQIIVLVLIVVLLFGAKRLPDLARSLGKSMRILRDETKSLTDPEDDAEKPAGRDGA